MLRGRACRTSPQPVPPGFPPTWSQTAYDGVTAALLKAYKDGDRPDLVGVLAAALRQALAEVVLADPRVGDAVVLRRAVVLGVPSAPSARRRRGRDPVADLVRRALRGQRMVRQVTPLRVARAVRDQAGLGARDRADNLRGSMTVRPRHGRLADDTVCIVVDDIVTTGSTLVEARRALERAGASYVVAATIAATRRHHPPAGADHVVHGRDSQR